MAAVLLCCAPTVTALEWMGTTFLPPICVKFSASKLKTELPCGLWVSQILMLFSSNNDWSNSLSLSLFTLSLPPISSRAWHEFHRGRNLAIEGGKWVAAPYRKECSGFFLWQWCRLDKRKHREVLDNIANIPLYLEEHFLPLRNRKKLEFLDYVHSPRTSHLLS